MPKFLLPIISIIFCCCSSLSAQKDHKTTQPKLSVDYNGTWTNNSHFLKIRNENTAWFDINSSCGIIFPIKKISSTSFEIIWDIQVDCVFDIKIDENFDVRETPIVGEPFAKCTIDDDSLKVEYYYPKWVNEFSKKSLSFLFTEKFSKMED